jgi:hypothetical protein
MLIKESGQTLVEVIVASTVGILVVVALTFATLFSLRNANFSKNSTQATKLAQEGLERVRMGRDRNSSISIPGTSVNSWNGSGQIWNYQIRASSGCDNPSTSGKCYFSVDSSGNLTNIGYGATVFPASFAEGVPWYKPVFKRVVFLSDDASYTTQKTVTVIVKWMDFDGEHESKMVTILSKQ